jgi:hypothetical protein
MPVAFSVHKRTSLPSGGSAKVFPFASAIGQPGAPSAGADRSDDDDDDDDAADDDDYEDALLGGDDDEEEAEGLDLEDEDGEEVLENDIDDRLMNHGPSAAVHSLSINGEVVQEHWKESDTNRSPTTAGPGGAPLTSNSPTSEASGGAESAVVSSPSGESKEAVSCRGPESGPDEEDEGEAADRPPYQYTAPTAEGPHGYIRIYSEMSQNDRDRYTDVIAAAARVFARTAHMEDTDGDEQEEEEEEAAAAEAEAAQSAGDDGDDDGGSRGNEWNVMSSVAYPSTHAFRDSDTTGSAGSSGGAQLAFGQKKKSSKTKTLSGRD